MSPSPWRLALGIRTEVTQRDYSAPLTITAIENPKVESGALELTGLWELTSANDHHHGYSSLVVLPNGNLLAGSDRGRLLTIPFNNGEPLGSEALFAFLPGRGEKLRQLLDLEALTLDRDTGDVWGAYEQSNSIERISPDGSYTSRGPLEIRRFSSNSGPETLQRLSDGRFLALGEGPEQRGRSNRPGVLFDRDPVNPSPRGPNFALRRQAAIRRLMRPSCRMETS